MKKKIIEKLKSLEKENNIEILLAIESGSRSWGFASPDSDYDIRFIYKHPIEWYLSPWEKKDTIEFLTDDLFDGSGWELKKTMNLLGKSNAPLMEHLHSHIIYIKDDSFLEKIIPIANEAYSPISVSHHYLNIARKYFESCKGDEVKLKNLFYCLRTTLATKWIIEKKNFPPIIIHEMFDLLPKGILNKVEALLKIKAENWEKYLHKNDNVIIEYLSNEIKILSNLINGLPSGNLDRTKAENVFAELIKTEK